MKKLNLTIIVAVLTLSVILAFYSVEHRGLPPTKSTNQLNSKTLLLFVLSSDAGEIYKKPDGYHLVLNHIDPKTLWFTDRPTRKAGFIPSMGFIDHWDKNFRDVPPNVAILHAGLTKSGNQVSPMAFELSHPVKLKDHSVSFTLRQLQGDAITPGTFKNVTLFIDCIAIGTHIILSNGNSASVENFG